MAGMGKGKISNRFVRDKTVCKTGKTVVAPSKKTTPFGGSRIHVPTKRNICLHPNNKRKE
jgi:hypothetical protein